MRATAGGHARRLWQIPARSGQPHPEAQGRDAFPQLPGPKLFKIFLKDPDDVTIELNFLGEVIDEKEWRGKGSASAVTLDRSAGKRTSVRKQS